MLLVEAEVEGRPISAILQNAETIRLMSPQGDATSITELRAGQEILVALEGEARHFGMKIQETIVEKIGPWGG